MSNSKDHRVGSPRPTRRRALLVSAILLGLTAALALSVHPLLNSRWFQDRLSEHIGLSIAWESARLRPSGQVRLRDLRIARDDPDWPVALALHQAAVQLDLPALLHRELRVLRLDAEGIRSLRFGDYRLEGDGDLAIEGAGLRRDYIDIDSLRFDLEKARVLREDEVLSRDLAIGARLQLTPLTLADNPGAQILRFISGDRNLSAKADAWDLFNDYLQDIPWLSLSGYGDLTAALSIDRGHLESGSRLRLDSPALGVTLNPGAHSGADSDGASSRIGDPNLYRLAGAGRVELQVVSTTAGQTETILGINLADVEMRDQGEDTRFLDSRAFRLESRIAGADLLQPPDLPEQTRLTWTSAVVPDIAVFSRYLPPGSPVAERGGLAGLDAVLTWEDDRLQGALDLHGDDVRLTLLETDVAGKLDLDLRINGLNPTDQTLDLSGTRLYLEAIAGAQPQESAPLITRFSLDEARFRLTRPVAELRAMDRLPDPLPVDGRLRLSGEINHLGFFDAFLGQTLGGRGIRLDGSGTLLTELNIIDSQPASGSRLTVEAGALSARLLDFEIGGAGALDARWLDGDAGERLTLETRFTEASLRHRDEPRPLLDSARIALEIETPAPSGQALADLSTDSARVTLRWDGARMPDVGVLDRYLPEQAPFRFRGGSALSEGLVRLDAQQTSGRLQLTGEGIGGELFETTVEGGLRLDLELKNLRLDSSALDLSGSRVELHATGDARKERLRTILDIKEARFTDWLDAANKPNRALQGRIALDGRVTQLGFLDNFLPREHGVRVRGEGRIDASERRRPRAALRQRGPEHALQSRRSKSRRRDQPAEPRHAPAHGHARARRQPRAGGPATRGRHRVHDLRCLRLAHPARRDDADRARRQRDRRLVGRAAARRGPLGLDRAARARIPAGTRHARHRPAGPNLRRPSPRARLARTSAHRARRQRHGQGAAARGEYPSLECAAQRRPARPLRRPEDAGIAAQRRALRRDSAVQRLDQPHRQQAETAPHQIARSFPRLTRSDLGD
ncbi:MULTISPECIES: hypothetical protein [unclassified Thiocapsa]|uniref:hypothetical protein n=1 Tax=unclassified Thiocapsa TaxID=2641286 RepID=UPI0035B4721A